VSSAAIGGVIGAIVGLAVSPVVGLLIERLPQRASLRPWRLTQPALPTLTSIVTLAAIGVRIRADAALPAYLYLGAVGVALAYIDLECRRLPNALTYPSYPALALLLLLATTDGTGTDYLRAVIAMAVYFGIFGLLWLLRPGDLGLGDVKLSGVLGLGLGWLGWGSWFIGLMSGFLIGGVVSLGLLVVRRAGLKTRVPYGPFMLSGALLGLLWGSHLATSYVGTHVG
jgi:leader peptidase (prepilin peptidase)/N-methyltransferase